MKEKKTEKQRVNIFHRFLVEINFSLIFAAEPLRFSLQPNDIIAEEGSNVILPCAATGSGILITYTWMKNGAMLHIDHKKYDFSGHGSLEIRELHRTHDNGNTFRCVVTNKYGSIISVSAVVQVACK